jgi:hypothetical protein
VEKREGRKKGSMERKREVGGGEEGIKKKKGKREGGEREWEGDGGRGGEIKGEEDERGVVVRTRYKRDGGEGVGRTKGE